MTNQMNQMNRQQLFNLINTVSFAVDDLLLFLDTHPDDVEAIKHSIITRISDATLCGSTLTNMVR